MDANDVEDKSEYKSRFSRWQNICGHNNAVNTNVKLTNLSCHATRHGEIKHISYAVDYPFGVSAYS
jgi:hypothetical protein